MSTITTLKQKAYHMRHKCLVFLDAMRGIDIREPETIKEVHQDLSRNFRYATAGKRSLEQAMKTMHIMPDDAILDIGCGKGGALAVFSKYPFRKLGGIELSSRLADIAIKNMQRLRIKNAEIFCCDATELTAIDDYTYIYFFNPFSSAVMEIVINNIAASLHRKPRKLTIIYNNPVCDGVIMRSGIFKKVLEIPRKDYAPCYIYQNTL
jgi:SAM-dependent methyltransferase